MRRLFNILLYGFLAICITVSVGSGLVYFLLSASVPDYDEDFTVAGLGGPVDILRDSSAVPHISATSAADVCCHRCRSLLSVLQHGCFCVGSKYTLAVSEGFLAGVEPSSLSASRPSSSRRMGRSRHWGTVCFRYTRPSIFFCDWQDPFSLRFLSPGLSFKPD